MRANARQPFLFRPPCDVCPAADCHDRGDPDRACEPIALQVLDQHALSHRSPQLPTLLTQLSDFRLPEALPPVPKLTLPPYVPQIDPSTPLSGRLPGTSALALSDFISKTGAFDEGIRSVTRLRERGASSVVLVGTSKDDRLEAVWKYPERFLDAVARTEIDLVLGPAFSIYLPPRMTLERLANRSRNIEMYVALRRAGIAALPAVGFIDAVDARRAAGWVTEHGLASVFIDAQSANSHTQWALAKEALVAFLDSARTVEQIVVNGVANPDRVQELVALVTQRDPTRTPVRLRLTNAHAFQLARMGRDYFVTDRGQMVRPWSAASREHIFVNLHRYYTRAVDGDSTRYAPLSLQPRML